MIIFLSASFSCTLSAADLLVVTRQDSEISSVTVTELSQLWLKQIYQVSGVKLEVADLFEQHPLRDQFYANIVGKSGNKLSAYWSIRVFRGEGFPPPALQSIEDLINWISAKKNRVAYIESHYLKSHLKVLNNAALNPRGEE
ncbi:MAG: hypothetical protein H8E21_05630 [Gammaproteobacteria bacterium]|nr:hypothetical protein [Gammaproteobacteria bacterium]